MITVNSNSYNPLLEICKLLPDDWEILNISIMEKIQLQLFSAGVVVSDLVELEEVIFPILKEIGILAVKLQAEGMFLIKKGPNGYLTQ